MNIPSIPTDNLYKFYAIFGILLLISSTTLMTYNAISCNKQSLDYEVQKQKIINDNVILLQQVEILRQEKVTTRRQADIMLKEREIAFKAVELWKINNLEKQMNSDREFFWWVSIVITLLSASLITYGFMMWKYKLQIYQDIIIKNEAEKSLDKEEKPETT